MIPYGEEPSNQLEMVLPGVNDKYHEVYEEVRRWASLHFSEWCHYRKYADEHRGKDGKASPNECLMALRVAFHVSIPNAWAPALARLAKEQDPWLDFRMAKSGFDACTKAKL